MIDSVIIVDWSARSSPSPARPSPDAIWWCRARLGAAGVEIAAPAYARTRAVAIERLASLVAAERAEGRRVLVGFDFPFGYPPGVAERIAGEPRALALWSWLAEAIEDDDDNTNNRFAVAERINRHYDGLGPMWGHPRGRVFRDLPPAARDRQGADHPPERRRADRAAGAKTVWQLAYAGSAGSQTLLGLPALERLRRDCRLRGDVQVWPFEAGLAVPEAPVVLAEVYPSLIRQAVAACRREGEVLDAAQVRANAAGFARLALEGRLEALFAGAAGLTAEERRIIETEEAWILGLGHAEALDRAARVAADTTPADRSRQKVARPVPASRTFTAAACPSAPPLSRSGPAPLRYERDPAAIYRQSFATVEAETRLDHLPAELRPVAVRLVHACGMPDAANRLAWSEDVVRAARAALEAGAPILCDCEMVASGIIRQRLPAASAVLCTLNDARVPARALAIGNTRSAAAVELWGDSLAGAVVAIGNAPTALFHLLELLDAGAPRPAAILGFPVGFVGAAESKAELARDPRGAAFLTLRGRRGGSAMAAAAVNALAAGAGR